MNSIFENREFCRDAFADELGDQKTTILAGMARAARSARRVRAARRIGIVACAALLSLLLLPKQQELPLHAAKPPVPKWIAKSVPFNGIVRTETLRESYIVRTAEATNVEKITDEQLLALAANHSAALVKAGDGARFELLDR
jgi:hypothetical protein